LFAPFTRQLLSTPFIILWPPVHTISGLPDSQSFTVDPLFAARPASKTTTLPIPGNTSASRKYIALGRHKCYIATIRPGFYSTYSRPYRAVPHPPHLDKQHLSHPRAHADSRQRSTHRTGHVRLSSVRLLRLLPLAGYISLQIPFFIYP
jgi:hypothetical protein